MLEQVVLAGSTVAVAAESVAVVRLWHIIHRFRHRKLLSTPSMLYGLPSVSVCIPARNERHAMTNCLESVLASKYPKLEVIVLDDSSDDNTSALIKSFAREGVRFIEGDPPQAGWLGKNYALEQLFSEANGSYILFLDVDTKLDQDSIGQLVAFAQTTRASMVSLLPVRPDVWRLSTFFATLRYFWPILFHSSSRPMVASSAWMVDRRSFTHDFGGFSHHKADVESEVTIASHFLKTHTYKFLVNRQLPGVTYEKKLSSQVETAIRLRYPRLSYSVLNTLVVTLLLLAVASVPLLGWLSGTQLVLSITAYLLGAVCYLLYLSIAWQRNAFVGMWIWPLIILFEALLTVLSYYRYATHTVSWKGRKLATDSQIRPLERAE